VLERRAISTIPTSKSGSRPYEAKRNFTMFAGDVEVDAQAPATIARVRASSICLCGGE